MQSIPAKSQQKKNVAVVGGGPAGMTIALLLARAGYKVKLFEAAKEVGGLWSVRFSDDGYYMGENSCKVYQAEYDTAPVLFKMLGTRWQDHFVPRYDLMTDWLKPFYKVKPFYKDCTFRDMLRFGWDLVLDALRLKSFKEISVEQYLEQNNISEGCQRWMRATALGGVTGTHNMSIWEIGHRFRANLSNIFGRKDITLYWNKQPPNAEGGFVSIWKRVLIEEGVEIHTNAPVTRVESEDGATSVCIHVNSEDEYQVEGLFMAVPPPALSKILEDSSESIKKGLGHDSKSLSTMLAESIYQHLGVIYIFDKPLPESYPLAGHSVRKSWYPIMVPFSQYKPYLRPGYESCIVASVSLVTGFLHHRLNKSISEYTHEEIARILWEDERESDPNLPEPVETHLYGLSSATQIVHHGTLPLQVKNQPIFIGTNLSGSAPYFTASLESAIQAGYAAAKAFDDSVVTMPTTR